MLPVERLEQIFELKEISIERDQAYAGESWARVDNCIVIYDGDNPPHWLPERVDELGDTSEFVKRMASAAKE
jgi:hypothetical protein